MFRLSFLLCAGLLACGGEPAFESLTGSGGAAPGGQGGDASSAAIGGATTSTGAEGGSAPGEACLDASVYKELGYHPVDIIVIIDNSSSMGDDLWAVETQLQYTFGPMLVESPLDWQVIVLSNHGPGTYDVCFGPPLTSVPDCFGPPSDSPRFHHYDTGIGSRDGLCRLLDTLGPSSSGAADEHGLHPEGWSKWLRPYAHKVFMLFSDDGVDCEHDGQLLLSIGDPMPTSANGFAAQVATTWDQRLRALAPLQFGTTADRRYRFHSFIGYDAPTPAAPLLADAAITDHSPCPGAQKPGHAYQWLSRGTGGLRTSICAPPSYQAVFEDVAAGIPIPATELCTFDLSELLGGVDRTSITVALSLAGEGRTILTEATTPGACPQDTNAFYWDGDVVTLCPATCAQLEQAPHGRIDVTGQCGP